MISSLLTDLYQLTMAYGYWKLGIHERKAVFHMLFRRNPFRGNYAVACGLAPVIDFLKNWKFTEDDLAYLRELKTPNGQILLPNDFLMYLKDLRFTCDVDAVPEGTVVFPHEPLIRITGPLIQGQLIESTLLNIINFQSLIATKSSRVYQVADGDSVVEFGLRRAQGPDGALSASRAAFIGGCDATSNVLAGKLYGIPVIGTHAHSWVTAFPDEMSAFEAYADVMPHNCVLLVDTYDTVQGVKNAITIGKKLQKMGGELRGIRLDSGDLASLSIKARALLDEAGFTQTQIICSNSLDEYVIKSLKEQGAPISIWGVGTNLVTAYDHPALDGVYKLSAIEDEKGDWVYKLKISEQAAKISNPGCYQVRRFYKDKKLKLDIMYDVTLGIPKDAECIGIDAPHAGANVGECDSSEDLLVPIMKEGKMVCELPLIQAIRQNAIEQVNQFLQIHGQNTYIVGLEKKVHELKQNLIKTISAKRHAD